MATIQYVIDSPVENEIQEGFAWSGTFVVPNVGLTPANSLATSVSGTVGDLTVTFTPDTTNGYKVYNSTTDANHYITWRSQNIETQYPNTGYSLDIWPQDGPNSLYDAIINNKTWVGLTLDGPYYLSNFKYTLLYNYNAPTAAMWCRGGRITFTEIA